MPTLMCAFGTTLTIPLAFQNGIEKSNTELSLLCRPGLPERHFKESSKHSTDVIVVVCSSKCPAVPQGFRSLRVFHSHLEVGSRFHF